VGGLCIRLLSGKRRGRSEKGVVVEEVRRWGELEDRWIGWSEALG